MCQPFLEVFVGHALRDVLPAINTAEFLTGVMRSMAYEIRPIRRNSENRCYTRVFSLNSVALARASLRVYLSRQ